MDAAAIRLALSEDLARHIAPVPLVGLEVSEDVDHDGEPVLRLRAVYDDHEATPSDDQVFVAHGVVATRLWGLGERRFPLLTFISLSDHRAEPA